MTIVLDDYFFNRILHSWGSTQGRNTIQSLDTMKDFFGSLFVLA
jgi:hypothetical protein